MLQRTRSCLDSRLARAGDDITHTRARLLALSPAATLKRGYAIVQDAGNSVVRSASELAEGQDLTVRFAEDHVLVRTTAIGESIPE
jgi:exodeoxyribonuclease VII large subunit